MQLTAFVSFWHIENQGLEEKRFSVGYNALLCGTPLMYFLASS